MSIFLKASTAALEKKNTVDKYLLIKKIDFFIIMKDVFTLKDFKSLF